VSTGSQLGAWLEELGSASPAPGGGAAAGVAAATGAALIAMVGHLTVGREGFEDLDLRMRDLIQHADSERTEFLKLADEDAAAFDAVMSAVRLPKDTDAEMSTRTLAVQEAYARAAEVPLELGRRAVELMELAEDATALGNPRAASDGYSAGAVLYAAALAAIANVRINASSLTDEAAAQGLVERVDALRERADVLLQQIEEAFLLRLTT
jgi:methenyltetrahydrofolate cyclohydrolase